MNFEIAETIYEKPLIIEYVSAAGRDHCHEIFASQLRDAEVGETLVNDSDSNAAGTWSESLLITVAHRTDSTIVLLIERKQWKDGNRYRDERKLVAIALA